MPGSHFYRDIRPSDQCSEQIVCTEAPWPQHMIASRCPLTPFTHIIPLMVGQGPSKVETLTYSFQLSV